MLQASDGVQLRETIKEHLARRNEAYELLKRERGAYGFSLEELGAFALPWNEERAQIKQQALSQGLSGKDFERIWKDVVAEQRL